MTSLECAKHIISVYLSNNLTPCNVEEILYINSGDKNVLKEHIISLQRIFTDALKELEDES